MTHHLPRLSLVIPAYNEERYLDACLAAVAAQTSMPDEVIVVDNSSTDTTAAIVRRYPFVTRIREPRQGLRFARNAGLDAASGDIIGRIDADTVLDPEWCARVRRLFADPAVQAATGTCYYYDMPMPRLGLWIDRLCRRAVSAAGKPILYGSNMAIRRTAWQRIRAQVCMRGTFFEDCDLTIHLSQAGYPPVFDAGLIAGVSARRLDDGPRAFYHNIRQFGRTYAMHGQRSAGARLAQCIYLAGYPMLKLIRRAYDPAAHRFSTTHFIHPRATPRPTSNT